MSNEKHYIVSCSYESKRQTQVGQGVVLGRLLPTLEQAAGIPAIGLAPFHRNFPSFPARVITTIDPSYRGVPIPMDVLQDREDLLLRSSYDSKAVAPKLLLDFGIDPDACPGLGNCPTILERAMRMLPRAQAPERYDDTRHEQRGP